MVFVKERVTVICEQLKKIAVAQKLPLEKWRLKKGTFLFPRDADAAPGGWEEFDSRTGHWYGPDEHYWFRAEFTVPGSFEGKPLYVVIKTQIDEYDDGKNPQFLMFVNGEITQGLDMNHREVLLTSCAKAGQAYVLDLQAYTGTLHSEFRLIGELVEINEQVNSLYYDLQTPLWGTQRMNKDDKTCMEILAILNETVNLLDLRKPHSAGFYESVDRARAFIQKKLYEELAGYDEVIATCIGHTHIDVAWWWTVAQTREKVARSFATVIKLMEEYPGYKFMSSQPQLYVFLKERYPALYEKVKENIRRGRWEPEGGMWLEADCNLTSGESLVRQFLHGKRFFRDEFGVDNRVMWLPDVFGYSAALPQIMKKCGIDYFMTTKLSWNQFNKIPCDTFHWKGIDGSEVLAYFVSTLDVGQSSDRFFTTYNGKLHPDSIMGGWERYQNKEINNDILIAFGHGDGGGGPTREMLEISSRMEKGVKGIPKVRQDFSLKYFEELEQRVKGNRYLPTWVGELYFEYHRGTYTSMARNKRSNRKAELMMMDLELLSVMAFEHGLDYPAEQLDSMWKTIMLNQFHDILPGTSIKEVYEVTRREYKEIFEAGLSLVAERLRILAGEGPAVTVFNTLGFERSSVVNLGELDGAVRSLTDGRGKSYPVQHTAEGALAYLDALPSKGFAGYGLCQDAIEGKPAFTVTPNSVETPFYIVTFDQSGLFTSIFDKENGREVMQPNSRANLMRVYEDKPIYYDNWDIDIYYTEKNWDLDSLVSMEWVENGPVRASLKLVRQFSDSTITQNICFYAGSRRIDFKTHVDWHEHQHLLKVIFPVEVHSDEASFDVQFGNVTRKIHKNTSWDMARFESCAHKWADLSEGNYGVSILNDCKYGHSIREGCLELTLIKSGIEPNPDTDREEHFFTYSLLPHRGAWREADTVHEAADLNQPVYVLRGGVAGTAVSFAAVDSAFVMLETIKRAESSDGIILRLYEYMNCRGPVKVTLNRPVQSVVECNLLEEPVENAAVESFGNAFTFQIKPYEIKTFKIVL